MTHWITNVCLKFHIYRQLSVYHSHNLNRTKQRITGHRQIWRWEKFRREKQRDTPDNTDNTAQYEGSNIPEMNLNLREIKLLSNLCWTQCCQHICILTVTHLACSLTLPARCGNANHRPTVTQEEKTVRRLISMSVTFTDFIVTGMLSINVWVQALKMLNEESKDKQLCYVVLVGEECSCNVSGCFFHVLFAFSCFVMSWASFFNPIP